MIAAHSYALTLIFVLTAASMEVNAASGAARAAASGAASGLTVAAASGGSVDDLYMDYSNEYDDVRPHLVYPDEPRLDKQISNAASEFTQSIANAWQSMVEQLKQLFSV